LSDDLPLGHLQIKVRGCFGTEWRTLPKLRISQEVSQTIQRVVGTFSGMVMKTPFAIPQYEFSGSGYSASVSAIKTKQRQHHFVIFRDRHVEY